jgi:DNA polymerase-3 subunit alpha
VNYLIKENLVKFLSYIKNLKLNFGDRFYIEIQRHNDQNELGFEKFNLNKSLELEIPIIATNEVFYLIKICMKLMMH